MKVIPRDQHCISRRHISNAALKILSRLRESGFQAYLVGGAVRDLLIGQRPKDFDIATDATPEAVHKLFRSSRIIGRRFRIVHVRMGRELIEVTTFRGHHQSDDDSGNKPKKNRQKQNSRLDNQSQQSASGLLLRDNVYGTLEEDAVRRDLTINALYYDSGTFELHDYVNGIDDIEARRIAIIGDPKVRFAEDPVRMLRVVRFAGKLGFDIDSKTAAGIPECSKLLGEIPAARLFDEFLKLFLNGYGSGSLNKLVEFDLFKYLFPEADKLLREDGNTENLLKLAMRNTDKRIAEQKPVTPAFILAAILWPEVERQQQQLHQQKMPPIPAMHSAAQQVLSRAVQTITIPKRFSLVIRDIWEFQLRLQHREGKRAAELVDHRRFRAAYDFLLLREEAGMTSDDKLGAWWTHFQTLPLNERLVLSAKKKGKSSSNKSKPNAS